MGLNAAHRSTLGGRTFSKARIMCKIREAGRIGYSVRASWYCKECFAGSVNPEHRVYLRPQPFG